MKFHVEKISAAEWSKYSRDAHLRVFKEEKPASWDRIDYALLVFKDEDKLPIGYMTCREIASDTVYWQYGGAFEDYRKSYLLWPAYKAFVEYAKGHYDYISTYTKNTNMPYLKMALKAGFRIIGTRHLGDEVYLDLGLALKEKKDEKSS